MKSQDTEAALDRARGRRPVVDADRLHAERRRQRARRASLLRVRCTGCASCARPSIWSRDWWRPTQPRPPGCSTSGATRAGVTRSRNRSRPRSTTSTCESVARTDIMRWKYRKLINNLSNAIDALCGPGTRSGVLSDEVRDGSDGVPRGGGNRNRLRGGRRCSSRRGVAVGQRRLPVAAGRVDVAEHGAWGLDRSRLPQRRDRAPRPSPWRAHSGQRRTSAAGQAGRAARASRRARFPSTK